VLAVLGDILLMRSEATLGLAVREGIGESEGDGEGEGENVVEVGDRLNVVDDGDGVLGWERVAGGLKPKSSVETTLKCLDGRSERRGTDNLSLSFIGRLGGVFALFE